MQKLKAYVHCPEKCKFVPMRFCRDCRYQADVMAHAINVKDVAAVACKHDKKCFEGDKS